MRTLAAPLALALLLPAAASAEPSGDGALQAQGQVLLDDLLGPGRSRLLLRRAAAAPAAPPAGPLWGDILGRAERVPSVLPGYRLPGSLAERALAALSPPRRRGRLSALLFLDSALDPERRQAAERAALDLLALEPDALSIRSVKMSSARPLSRLLRSPAAAAPSPWRAAASAAGSGAAAGAALGLLLLAAAPLLRALGRRPGRPSARRPLALLNAAHARWLARMLAGEPPRAVAAALRGMRAELAAAVFRLLDPALRAEAALALLRAPARSAGLRARLAGALGGYSLLEQILLRCGPWTREDALARLEAADPGQARRLRAGLVSLNDLAMAEPESLRLCLGPYSEEEVALALYGAPEETSEALLKGLAPAAAESVRRRGRHLVPSSLERVELARGEILARWRRLEDAGRVAPLSLAGALP